MSIELKWQDDKHWWQFINRFWNIDNIAIFLVNYPLKKTYLSRFAFSIKRLEILILKVGLIICSVTWDTRFFSKRMFDFYSEIKYSILRCTVPILNYTELDENVGIIELSSKYLYIIILFIQKIDDYSLIEWSMRFKSSRRQCNAIEL